MMAEKALEKCSESPKILVKASEEGTVQTPEEFRKLCSHYSRGCSLVSPCCNKVYPCRVCHNEKELHEIDRFAITEIVCRKCEERQKIAKTCIKCSLTFSRYTCFVCNLFDDAEKGQYHCSKCGICRIGGRDNFFHCDTCGLCLQKSLKEAHKCVQQASHSNCPVCMEDLHSSRTAAHVPRCGHLLHNTCFQEMLKNNLYQCPQCQTSMLDMSSQWERMDEERQQWVLPPELQSFSVKIQCRDCRNEGDALFHFIGLKCTDCGSYNTVRCGNEILPLNDVDEVDRNVPDHIQAEEEEDEYYDEDDEDGSVLIHIEEEALETDHILQILDRIFPNDPADDFFEDLLDPDSNEEGEDEEEDDVEFLTDEVVGGANLILDPLSGLIDILPHHLNLNNDPDHDDDDDDEDEENAQFVPPWMNPSSVISTIFGTGESNAHHFLPYLPPTATANDHLQAPQIWEVSSDEGEAAGESESNDVVQGEGEGGEEEAGEWEEEEGQWEDEEGQWETSSEEETVGGDEENLGKECLLPEEEATNQLEDVAPAH